LRNNAKQIEYKIQCIEENRTLKTNQKHSYMYNILRQKIKKSENFHKENVTNNK